MRIYTLSHSRVPTYRVTHNQKHHNFLISPSLLHEDTLKFIYRNDDIDVVKFMPVMYLGKHLKFKKIFHIDEVDLKAEYRGEAYEIDENLIFEYND